MRILSLSQWYVPEPDFKIHALGQDFAARAPRDRTDGLPELPTRRPLSGLPTTVAPVGRA